MTGCEQTDGGIAASNQNFLRAVVTFADSINAIVDVVSLHESGDARPEWLMPQFRFVGARGSRLAMLWSVIMRIRRSSLIVVDHVGLTKGWWRIVRNRLVIIGHGSEVHWRMQSFARRALARADLILTNSEFTARQIRLRIPSANVEATLLGLPPSKSTGKIAGTTEGLQRWGIQSNRYLFIVGRMDKTEANKGHDALISALALARDRDLRLVVAGEGTWLPELREQARSSGLEDRVIFVGRVADSTLALLYSGCLAFVLPSAQEGFGLVFVEAMSFGKPCVALNHGGAPEVVENDVSGILLASRRPEHIARAIDKLTMDADFTTKIGHKAKQTYLSRFTPEHAQSRVVHALTRHFGDSL